MKPHSGDNGIEYLTALVRAQFDPDAAEPPLLGTKTNQKSNRPKTIQELRRQMAQQLAEKIRQEFRPGVASLFVLTERQAATLEALALPPELTEEVLSLNWLREEPWNHAVNGRLETIATMPPSDEGKKPDWKRSSVQKGEAEGQKGPKRMIIWLKFPFTLRGGESGRKR